MLYVWCLCNGLRCVGLLLVCGLLFVLLLGVGAWFWLRFCCLVVLDLLSSLVSWLCVLVCRVLWFYMDFSICCYGGVWVLRVFVSVLISGLGLRFDDLSCVIVCIGWFGLWFLWFCGLSTIAGVALGFGVWWLCCCYFGGLVLLLWWFLIWMTSWCCDFEF